MSDAAHGMQNIQGTVLSNNHSFESKIDDSFLIEAVVIKTCKSVLTKETCSSVSKAELSWVYELHPYKLWYNS